MIFAYKQLLEYLKYERNMPNYNGNAPILSYSKDF